jgi:hypothetical protein
MQQGSEIREHRKLGPDVWVPMGGKQDRTVTECIAESSWELIGSLPSDWCRKSTDIRLAGISMTVAVLADHVHQRELGRSNGRISYSTKKAYQGYQMDCSASGRLPPSVH